MAPELLTEEDMDIKPLGTAIDIWALGVTLYCFVVGRLPFDAEGEYEMYQQIISEEPVLDPADLEEDLIDLLKKMLTKDPLRRITAPEIKKHPWVTEDIDANEWIEATDPTKEAVISVTKEEVNNAITTFFGKLKRKILDFLRPNHPTHTPREWNPEDWAKAHPLYDPAAGRHKTEVTGEGSVAPATAGAGGGGGTGGQGGADTPDRGWKSRVRDPQRDLSQMAQLYNKDWKPPSKEEIARRQEELERLNRRDWHKKAKDKEKDMTNIKALETSYNPRYMPPSKEDIEKKTRELQLQSPSPTPPSSSTKDPNAPRAWKVKSNTLGRSSIHQLVQDYNKDYVGPTAEDIQKRLSGISFLENEAEGAEPRRPSSALGSPATPSSASASDPERRSWFIKSRTPRGSIQALADHYNKNYVPPTAEEIQRRVEEVEDLGQSSSSSSISSIESQGAMDSLRGGRSSHKRARSIPTFMVSPKTLSIPTTPMEGHSHHSRSQEIVPKKAERSTSADQLEIKLPSTPKGSTPTPPSPTAEPRRSGFSMLRRNSATTAEPPAPVTPSSPAVSTAHQPQGHMPSKTATLPARTSAAPSLGSLQENPPELRPWYVKSRERKTSLTEVARWYQQREDHESAATSPLALSPRPVSTLTPSPSSSSPSSPTPVSTFASSSRPHSLEIKLPSRGKGVGATATTFIPEPSLSDKDPEPKDKDKEKDKDRDKDKEKLEKTRVDAQNRLRKYEERTNALLREQEELRVQQEEKKKEKKKGVVVQVTTDPDDLTRTEILKSQGSAEFSQHLESPKARKKEKRESGGSEKDPSEADEATSPRDGKKKVRPSASSPDVPTPKKEKDKDKYKDK